MRERQVKIGIMAPGSRIDPDLAQCATALCKSIYMDRVELSFHKQCFLSSGHFAGNDAMRAHAFLDIANDASFDALWFARGGYGSCRIAEAVLKGLKPQARKKRYLGYSDAGALLAGLYANGFNTLAHGPMVSDLTRDGGETAVKRALAFLVDRAPITLEKSVRRGEPTVAFNVSILSQIIGTPLQPDLAGHVLMLEEVSEYLYRIDRSLFHITSNANIRKVAGIRLGRCNSIPANDPDFKQSDEQVVRHWCRASTIRYLGRADIGHDVGNKIVPFGRLPLG